MTSSARSLTQHLKRIFNPAVELLLAQGLSRTALVSGQKTDVFPQNFTQVAAEVFLFDAIIVNADRRPANPNCLTSGNEIAIFDHELSFSQAQELFLERTVASKWIRQN